MRFSSILACAAAAPLLIAAVQPVRLTPSGKWVLDYAENSCRLVRQFGEGNAKIMLQFESSAPGQTDMVVIGKPLSGDADEVPARFVAGQIKPMKGQRAKTTVGGVPAILWSSVPMLPDDVAERLERKIKERTTNRVVRPPPLDLAEQAAIRAHRQQFAATATELVIETRRSRPVILETGSLGGPIGMFDKCSRDSLRDWGVDPEVEDRIVRPVWTSGLFSLFSGADYPAKMVMTGQESEVRVRVLVDASGKVTKCTSLSHFDAPEFNRVVCNKFTARARFEPAELADGTKVPSYATTQVIFRIAQ